MEIIYAIIGAEIRLFYIVKKKKDMEKAHEVNLTLSLFGIVEAYNYFIIENQQYETGDYILFKEVETVEKTIREHDCINDKG